MSDNLGHFNHCVEAAEEAAGMAENRLEVTRKLVGDYKQALEDNSETVEADLKAARSDIIAAKREIENAMKEFEDLTSTDVTNKEDNQ